MHSSVVGCPDMAALLAASPKVGRAVIAQVSPPGRPVDSSEGLMRFPVRWDAVSKAAGLQALTGLAWEVRYDARTDRFVVGLGTDSTHWGTAASSACVEDRRPLSDEAGSGHTRSVPRPQ